MLISTSPADYDNHEAIDVSSHHAGMADCTVFMRSFPYFTDCKEDDDVIFDAVASLDD